VRLREAIAAGKLREDLYYRLNVLTIDLPPLRDRAGDVEVLATYFLREIARELHREIQGFTPRAMAAMLAHPWPGNVRELIATIRRAVVLANGPLIDLCDLRLEAAPGKLAAPAKAGAKPPRPPAGARPEPGSETERESILRALQENRFNMTHTARGLGVSRATLYRMLQRNRIELAQQFLVRDVQLGRESG
jgi:DNA-binding NtrC family response regulator